MSTKKTKQPHELLDFDFNGSRPLGNDDTISNVTATYTGPDQALVIENISWDDIRGKVWLSGGTSGKKYKVTALIQTVAGRTLESEFMLYVKDL